MNNETKSMATGTSGNSIHGEKYDDWRQTHFDASHLPVATLIFKKAFVYGPFFCVHSKEELEPTNTIQPHDNNESQHWVGMTRPETPDDAGKWYALPESNTKEYLYEIFLIPSNEEARGFIGIPWLGREGSQGSTLAINLNNEATKPECLKVTKFRWDPNVRKYLETAAT